ncbi:caspase family protein [Desulfogranum mediterraneum]|uniref:caspase family protein n=1 Tax=Desulfogranum mediterraneum TaxID=160661 RepID=UPI0004038466|nr:caspase family protein [Desulfogranum mediterraneum]
MKTKLMLSTLLLCWLVPALLLAADRALLIGIDRYANVRPLRGAVNDVKRVHSFLTDRLRFPEGQIKVLLNQEASRKNILASLDSWLVAGSEAGDRIFFYYSGHGYFQPDLDGDEQDRVDETLVSYDSLRREDSSIEKMVSDDEIGRVLEALADRQVVVVIDSCHSGTMARGVGLSKEQGLLKIPVFPRRQERSLLKAQFRSTRREESFLKGNGSRLVWSAVSASQSALENNELSPMSGVFTNAFLNGVEQGLADGNGNGRVTNSELLDYVQRESAAFCRRHAAACTLGLTPSLETSAERLAEPVFFSFGYGQDSVQGEIGQGVTDILAHDNGAKISLDILPSNRLRLGEEIQLRVSSPVDGYLVVLDINANQEVTQLFPNSYSDRAGQGNMIQAQRPVVIPNSYYGFRLPAGEPVGDGLLLAIVSEDPLPLDDLLAAGKDLQVIQDSRAYLTKLALRLRQTWRQDRYNRQLRWSLAEKEYHITR